MNILLNLTGNMKQKKKEREKERDIKIMKNVSDLPFWYSTEINQVIIVTKENEHLENQRLFSTLSSALTTRTR